MAFDAFLKLEGIEGESTDRTHKGEIEISSFSWGVSNTGSSGGSGGGAGKALLQDFHFTMPTSKASPNLMLACATGRHSQQATLTCRRGEARRSSSSRSSWRTSSSPRTTSAAPTAARTGRHPLRPAQPHFVKIDFLYTVERDRRDRRDVLRLTRPQLAVRQRSGRCEAPAALSAARADGVSARGCPA